MRAREFITEQVGKLPPETAQPMQNTFILPGIRNNDAYQTMRFSVAIARARAEAGGYEPDLPEFTSVSAVGRNAMIIGFNDGVDDVIDRALKMTDTPGGKELIGSQTSEEPKLVNKTSPVKGFKGYPR
jgi:hypothetical protein